MIELPNECGEFYADLDKGGMPVICQLPRCHHGSHGRNLVNMDVPTVQEKNQQFDAFLSSLLKDMERDQQPLDGPHIIKETA